MAEYRNLIKAAWIDIDNTLISFDAYVKQTMREGFAHFGLKPYEPYMFDVFTTENDKLWRSLERGELTFIELKKIRFRNIFAALGISFDGETFEKYFRDQIYDNAIPEPGAYEMLTALKEKGLILCAASNGPYEQQIHRLGVAKMDSFFDYCFISEEIGASKPAPLFYEEGFQRMNEGRMPQILPDECVMIGDSLTSDMAGGMDFGMKTCFYRRKKDTVVPDGIDVVVEDLREIAQHFEGVR